MKDFSPLFWSKFWVAVYAHLNFFDDGRRYNNPLFPAPLLPWKMFGREISVLATSMIVAVTTFWYTWSMSFTRKCWKKQKVDAAIIPLQTFSLCPRPEKLLQKSGDFNASFKTAAKQFWVLLRIMGKNLKKMSHF